MIIHSIMPIEQIFDGFDTEQSDIEEVTVNGLIMQVQSINSRQARIVRLMSSNPQDYLNPAYAPGQIIQMHPSL